MQYILKDPISNNALRCEEFNLRSKHSDQAHMFAAYANQEVTDYFEFCDQEGLEHKVSEQLQIVTECESNQVQEQSLINDFDLQLIGEQLDLEQYESFKVENTRYNLKRDIKIDKSDLGKTEKSNRKIGLKYKLEQMKSELD